MKHWLSKTLPAALLGGLVVWVLLTLPTFSLKSDSTKIDAVTLLQILVTLAIASWIQQHVVPRSADFRVEKNLIQTEAIDAQKLVKEARDVFHAAYALDKIDAEYLRQVGLPLRNLANKLYFLEDMVQECKIDADSNRLAAVKSAYFAYKKAITGSIQKSAKTFNDADATFRLLNKEIFRFIIHVNRIK